MSDRRLIFLDALRGFFILYVVWLHATIGVVFNNNPEALNTVPRSLLIILAPIMILATWAPIFVVVSGAANAYVLHNVVKRHREKHHTGVPFRSFMAGSLVTGIFLYGLSMFNMAFYISFHSNKFAAKGKAIFFSVPHYRNLFIRINIQNLLIYKYKQVKISFFSAKIPI